MDIFCVEITKIWQTSRDLVNYFLIFYTLAKNTRLWLDSWQNLQIFAKIIYIQKGVEKKYPYKMVVDKKYNMVVRAAEPHHFDPILLFIWCVSEYFHVYA